ncbi:Histidine protein methyltransferase 1 [Pseudozyma hubeiensis]|nr:Histidine protein methyltransferase 1 [Pseudozyma hubeiensis]
MSFGFQFEESEMDEEYVTSPHLSIQSATATASTPAQASSSNLTAAPFQSHTLHEMLQNLPSRISYSAIDVILPGTGGDSSRVQRLLRRDLFDARFQMLIDDDDDEEDETSANGTASQHAHGNVDAQSDLIPGVYEGGLKTWECALDLVETLDALHSTASPSSWSSRLSGKSVLELGCGTALPSLFILSQVLNEELSNQPLDLTFHLADYNAQVLQLVTLPNLLLTWYASTSSASYRSSTEAVHTTHERNELLRRGQDHFDAENELAITSDLVAAFSASLSQRGIHLNFHSGAWSEFPPTLGAKMDVILTSETIYSLESLPALVDVVSRYAGESALTLVAAKVIYFGVGGGVESFKETLAEKHPQARIEPLLNVTKGVGRTVLSVTF